MATGPSISAITVSGLPLVRCISGVRLTRSKELSGPCAPGGKRLLGLEIKGLVTARFCLERTLCSFHRNKLIRESALNSLTTYPTGSSPLISQVVITDEPLNLRSTSNSMVCLIRMSVLPKVFHRPCSVFEKIVPLLLAPVNLRPRINAEYDAPISGLTHTRWPNTELGVE